MQTQTSTVALIAPGTHIAPSAQDAKALQTNFGDLPNRSISEAFRNGFDSQSTNQPEDVKANIKNLSHELSSQLQNKDRTDTSFSIENKTLDTIFFEDSNNDGIINEGDNIVISFTDDTGESNNTRIPVTEEFAALIQGINGSDIQGVNSLFMDQFLTLFIEQMKVEILHQNSLIRDMISEGSPDFSL